MKRIPHLVSHFQSFLATRVLSCLIGSFNEIIIERERYRCNCSEHIIQRNNKEDQIMMTSLLRYIHKYREHIRKTSGGQSPRLRFRKLPKGSPLD